MENGELAPGIPKKTVGRRQVSESSVIQKQFLFWNVAHALVYCEMENLEYKTFHRNWGLSVVGDSNCSLEEKWELIV